MTDTETRQQADRLQPDPALGTAAAIRSEQSVTLAPIVQEGPGQLLSAIVAMAKDPAVDVQKLQALLSMQEHMEERQEQRDRVAAFNRDFDAMRKRLPKVKRDGTLEYAEDKKRPDGPMRTISKFPKWETVMDTIGPLMQEFGFWLTWDTVPRQGDGGGLICTGTLHHQQGHFQTASIPLPLDTSGGKNNLQGYGSTSSYGQRYTTKMLLNLVYEGEDDDGKRGGMRFISPDDIKVIRAMMVEAGVTDEARFLMAMQHTHIENIEAGEVNLVKNILAQRISDRKQKATPA